MEKKQIQEDGNTEEPTPEPTPDPIPDGKTAEELSKDDMVGKYVAYEPAGTKYEVDATNSGTGSKQDFEANVGTDGQKMKWRIFDVDKENNKLLLISEQLAKSDIRLSGENGYNNAVQILTDACATAYGNASYGSAVKVRSINMEDIDGVTGITDDTVRKQVDSRYGNTYTPAYKQCPSIYLQEPGTETRSAQSRVYTGTTSFSGAKTYTYYSYSIITRTAGSNAIYCALLTNMASPASTGGTDRHTSYWVATRCVSFDDRLAFFSVYNVSGGSVWSSGMYYSDRMGFGPSFAVRPVVEVDLNKVEIGADETTDGSRDNPYSMELTDIRTELMEHMI